MPSFDLELRKRMLSEIDPVPQIDTRQSAQIQFSYQLPLGGAGFSRKREAAERKLAAQAGADAELLRVREEVVQRWSAWREARAIAADLEERVAASARVVAAYDLQFAAARRSLNDLIVARGDHHRSASDLLDNRMEQLAGGAQVLSLLGRLRQTVLGERDAEVSSDSRQP
jgi:outer membrane protein TolC